jgi:preprotein translocase subunit YajC
MKKVSGIFTLIVIIFSLLFSIITQAEAKPAQKQSPKTNKIQQPDKKTNNGLKGTIQQIEGNQLGISSDYSFKLDKEGAPSLAYYDLNDQELKFARVEKSRWVINTVTQFTAPGDGVRCSLGFDNNNNPYIAYMSSDRTLNLATCLSKKWTTETVDKTKNSGYFCCLRFISNSEPVITYQGNNGLMFARKSGNTWAIEKIDNPGETSIPYISPKGEITVFYTVYETLGKRSTLKLKTALKDRKNWKTSFIANTESCIDFDIRTDSAGKSFIAFTNGREIKAYIETVDNSGIWKEERIAIKDCSRISLSFADNYSPYVCYISNDSKELNLARKNSDKWDIDNVATARTGYRFLNCSVLTDKKNRPIIVVHDGDALNALILQKSSWAVGRIAGKIRVGGYISATLDSNQLPMVAYYDYSRQELHFAYRLSENLWRLELIDTLGDVGRYCCLSTDNKGIPGISYFDKTRGDLKYAWKDKGSWKWDRVDINRNSGLYTSLVYDSKNTPCISYYNSSDNLVNFAAKSGKKWCIEKIAATGGAGGETLLVVKPNGKFVVFFTDGEKPSGTSSEGAVIKMTLKIAERIKPGQWKISILADSDTVSVGQSNLSASVSKNGELALSFIDKGGKLHVLRSQGETWRDEIVDFNCWESTSIKFNSDGNLALLYIKGDTKNNVTVHFARYEGAKWASVPIDLPQSKIEFVSLADSPRGIIRFAYGDAQNFISSYFEKNENSH